MLYPQNNEKRVVMNYNGVWNFDCVCDDYVPNKPLENPIAMPVPASYNDVTCDRNIKDYVGNVLYERSINISQMLKSERIFLRIGSACHKQMVYINGKFISKHNGGFLPVDVEITDFVSTGSNRLSIVVDNRLSFATLPIGEVSDGKQTIHHDFYNYSGIHRDVLVYTVPTVSIDDIVIKTELLADSAIINFLITTASEDAKVNIYDCAQTLVAETNGKEGSISIKNPKVWDIGQGNLYTFEVITESDCYREKFGIRKIEISNDKILLNNKPVYFKGFGKHEDFAIIGKGNCTAVNIRDFNMLKWINANSFRTSHYPYAEELLDLADREGFLVIDEIPAVGFNFWSSTPVFTEDRVSEQTLQVHKQQLTELIQRDKNHPCVVLLSIGNEPASYEEASGAYFAEVAKHARAKSPWPLMLVENVNPYACKTSSFVDVIGVNKYNAWYNDHAELTIIYDQLKKDLAAWHNQFNKPIIVTEFGADTIEGNHYLPSESFSEEFQWDFLQEFMKVFDELPFVVGEHIWAFADFKTKQGLTRVRGNRKGIFTRDRQPKYAAHKVKERWAGK